MWPQRLAGTFGEHFKKETSAPNSRTAPVRTQGYSGGTRTEQSNGRSDPNPTDSSECSRPLIVRNSCAASWRNGLSVQSLQRSGALVEHHRVRVQLALVHSREHLRHTASKDVLYTSQTMQARRDFRVCNDQVCDVWHCSMAGLAMAIGSSVYYDRPL